MRALVDTHGVLWFAFADRRLGQQAKEFLEDDSIELLLSAVIPWEIVIKYKLGRLPDLKVGPDEFVSRVIGRFTPLAIEIPHALTLGALPPLHADPFDRMLVAQARYEGLPILTSDPQIARYDVETIW